MGEAGSELQALDVHVGLSRSRPTRGYGRLGPDMSTRLLFLAEEQGRGISPAACGPPRCPLPSPAPTTNHLLRRPQRPLTGLPATQAATGHRAGGCEVPRANPSAEHGLDRGGRVTDEQALTTERFTSPPEGRINRKAGNSCWKPTHSERSLCHISAQSPQPWGFPMASKCHPGTL